MLAGFSGAAAGAGGTFAMVRIGAGAFFATNFFRAGAFARTAFFLLFVAAFFRTAAFAFVLEAGLRGFAAALALALVAGLRRFTAVFLVAPFGFAAPDFFFLAAFFIAMCTSRGNGTHYRASPDWRISAGSACYLLDQ
jgi:hypothetical protein